MNLKRIIKEEINRPSEAEFKQALKDVRTMVPIIAHKIIHDKKLGHDTETVEKLNQEILKKVEKGDDEILDEMWELAGTLILKNAINIITFYTK